MSAPARETPSFGQAAAWGVVALGLVAVVAMEAHGAAWSSDRGAHARVLPHGVVVAALITGIVGAAIVLVIALAGTRIVSETPEQRRRRWAGAIAFLIVIAAISVLRLLAHPHPPTGAVTPAVRAAPGAPAAGNAGGAPSDETWWPLVIVGFGAALAVIAAIVRRPRVRTDPDGGLDADAATLAMLDASIDDLSREPDPRRAVVAAYARMERGLARHGFARAPAETPTEYLQRALATGAGGIEPIAALTALAERARFSTLTVDETMREHAIVALQALRTELRSPTAVSVGAVE